MLPAELGRKVFPHLSGGFCRRQIIFSLTAIEAPDDSLGKVFESFQIVSIFDGVFVVFSTIAVYSWSVQLVYVEE